MAEPKVLVMETVQRETRAICWLIQTQRGLVGPVVNLQPWKKRGSGLFREHGHAMKGRVLDGAVQVLPK